MARPLRIEFPGAIYHVTSRGDRCERIFMDAGDRLALLRVVDQALHRFEARMLAYCLMGNHYHFVLQTGQANLSRVMRQINGVYTQAFNARHGLVGHLFQGRFKAILVDRDAYLLEVCRYVELNPVRAGMVTQPEDWPWSSYLVHVGQSSPLAWLDSETLHAFLLGRDPRTAADRRAAMAQYAGWVGEGLGMRLWDEALRQQIYLGDDAFIERMQAKATPVRRTSPATPSVQRNRPWSLSHWFASSRSTPEALLRAHIDGGFSMSVLAKQLGQSVSTISRMIRAAEQQRGQEKGIDGVIQSLEPNDSQR